VLLICHQVIVVEGIGGSHLRPCVLISLLLHHGSWLSLDVLAHRYVAFGGLLAKVAQAVRTLVVRVLGTPIHQTWGLLVE